MTWSDKEIYAIGDKYFRGLDVTCPKCSGPISIQEIEELGSPIARLFMNCRRCGESGSFEESHLEEMNLQWTFEQKVAIIEKYWANGYVMCPIDQTLLNVEEMRSIGDPKAVLMIRCRRCGRTFSSNEIDKATSASPFEQQYEILRDIGQGGMGTVRLVRSRSDGHEYAAKTISPEFLRDPVIIRRFQRETRILQTLVHPNIIQIRNTFIDETGAVIIMDYLPGGDLAAKINNKSVSNGELVALFDNIVAGLEEVHRAGIIHRDLKPWNILIDREGHAVISDFGLAVLLDRDSTRLTKDGQFVGSRHYAAPEQLAGQETGPSVDIYALGLIAYEIFTRTCPYSPPIVLPTGNESLKLSLSVALANTPQNRTITCSEIGLALRQAML
jgi:serine/threonine protein kinase